MSATTTEALWRVVCAMARRLRKRSDETPAEARASGSAQWRDAMARRHGSAMTRSSWRDDCAIGDDALRRESAHAMARRLRKRYDASSTAALWRVVCGIAMARRLRKRYGATTAEALWYDACGGAMARRLRKRSDETAAEALWRDACGSAVE